MISLAGQSAIVTGAGAGIGREIALLLSRRGARVLVNDYGGDFRGNAGDQESAEAVVREITATGGTAVANGTAVGTAAAAREIHRAALDAFGRVDILVNNAGVTLPGGIAETAQADIERIVLIDYWGPYHLMRTVWPDMAARGYGRIVNFTSNAVIGGYGGFAPYASAKGGVLGLTTDAGTEGKSQGILVNAVVPLAYTRLAGADVTAPTDEFARWLKHYFNPRHIAPVVAYLSSREASVSGEIFCAGAGRVSRLAFVNGDGFHSAELTPEQIAQHIDQVRSLGNAAVVASGADEMNRYMRWSPYPAPGDGSTED
jgi:NAD(P)-dependent dehydrogenase (short-subunit alcohol dehydrogenase family)